MATPNFPIPGPRIVIVGVTGSGKTTLAQELSELLKIPYIELDAVHWLPNWEMMERDAFRARVAELTAVETWIADGNYRKARDILWARATTLIWLDYPFHVSFYQLCKRTFGRLIHRTVLWNGNTESWKLSFLSRDSLFLWAFQSYPEFRKSYPGLLAQPENAHLQVIRLRSRKEKQAYINFLTRQTATKSQANC